MFSNSGPYFIFKSSLVSILISNKFRVEDDYCFFCQDWFTFQSQIKRMSKSTYCFVCQGWFTFQTQIKTKLKTIYCFVYQDRFTFQTQIKTKSKTTYCFVGQARILISNEDKAKSTCSFIFQVRLKFKSTQSRRVYVAASVSQAHKKFRIKTISKGCSYVDLKC